MWTFTSADTPCCRKPHANPTAGSLLGQLEWYLDFKVADTNLTLASRSSALLMCDRQSLTEISITWTCYGTCDSTFVNLTGCNCAMRQTKFHFRWKILSHSTHSCWISDVNFDCQVFILTWYCKKLRCEVVNQVNRHLRDKLYPDCMCICAWASQLGGLSCYVL
jgi:hypothetical protein